jgi:hypothetical protein
MLTQEHLKVVMTYNPDTGHIYNNLRPNKALKAINSCGYITVRVFSKSYVAHRLAFLYMTGEFPAGEVDHINGLRSDNRWCNLRLASKSDNLCNAKAHSSNKLGIKGIHFNKLERKYKTQVRKQGYKTITGTFETLEEAIAFVQESRIKLHKEFTNHGQ